MDNNEIRELINQKSQEIINLQCDLTSSVSPIGDWKLIKQQESILLGHNPPYTDEIMKEYSDSRQLVRDKINLLQSEISELTNSIQEEGD